MYGTYEWREASLVGMFYRRADVLDIDRNGYIEKKEMKKIMHVSNEPCPLLGLE